MWVDNFEKGYNKMVRMAFKVLKSRSLFWVLIWASVGWDAVLLQTGDSLELGALEEIVFVWQEVVLEIIITEFAVLLSLMDPVSVLHDNVSVEFVHPELYGFDLSVQSTEQQKSSTSNTRNTKVLIELSLADFSNTKSSNRDKVSSPGEYGE